MEANHNSGTSGNPRQSRAMKAVLNLLLILITAVVLGWLVMSWLDWWTGHGKTAVVPSVKGMPYEQAVATIENAGMVVELNDSMYDSKMKPGAVIEQNPSVGSVVKPGRTVYLTINAFYPRMVTVPVLTDVSLRQATSALEGLGITDIVKIPVVSEYKDLVLGAETGGKPLSAGMRIPVNAKVILKVGDGSFVETEPDTISSDASDIWTD